MLKKGDLIIAPATDDKIESWWVMTRDELDDDYRHHRRNAELVSQPAPRGFEDRAWTSWDSRTVIDQRARVVRADEWTDEMCVKVAQWALLQ